MLFTTVGSFSPVLKPTDLHGKPMLSALPKALLTRNEHMKHIKNLGKSTYFTNLKSGQGMIPLFSMIPVGMVVIAEVSLAPRTGFVIGDDMHKGWALLHLRSTSNPLRL